MSDTTTNAPTDGNTTATPSSSVDTTRASPSATHDSSPPSSGSQTDTPSSSDGSHQSDRDGLLAAVRQVVRTDPEPRTVDTDDASGDDAPSDQAVAREGEDAPPGDKPPSETTATDKPQDKPQDTTEDLDLNAPDPSEQELRKLRPETRRRFNRLLAQRDEARRQLEGLQPELTQHRQLQGYLQANQLAPDDVNVLLGVGAALRREDYKGFLDGVMPYVQAAQEALGLRISPDLAKQVDDGVISEEAAREMTRTRHRAAQAEHRLQSTTQRVQQDTTQRTAESIRQAVDNWEANIRARDADYLHKANAVRRYSQALIQERGIPQTVEQAVALTQAAYDEATREFGRFQPQPKPTRATPSSIHVATNGAGGAEPKTMKDAVLLSLASMRRAS